MLAAAGLCAVAAAPTTIDLTRNWLPVTPPCAPSLPGMCVWRVTRRLTVRIIVGACACGTQVERVKLAERAATATTAAPAPAFTQELLWMAHWSVLLLKDRLPRRHTITDADTLFDGLRRVPRQWVRVHCAAITEWQSFLAHQRWRTLSLPELYTTQEHVVPRSVGDNEDEAKVPGWGWCWTRDEEETVSCLSDRLDAPVVRVRVKRKRTRCGEPPLLTVVAVRVWNDQSVTRVKLTAPLGADAATLSVLWKPELEVACQQKLARCTARSCTGGLLGAQAAGSSEGHLV